MDNLTDAQRAMLVESASAEYHGLRPGDNMWSLVEFSDPRIDGEEVDALIRWGLLECTEMTSGFTILTGYDDLPDLECRWAYTVTDAGRAALASI